MIFDEWRKERAIKAVLRALARQRVAMILQPGNVWVVEYAPQGSDQMDVALRTCHLRGWVEPIQNAVPTGELKPDGSLPDPLFRQMNPVYRLTEGGWHVINRTQRWIVATFVVAAVTLVVTIIGIILTARSA
jgi:hypothetical protein